MLFSVFRAREKVKPGQQGISITTMEPVIYKPLSGSYSSGYLPAPNIQQMCPQQQLQQPTTILQTFQSSPPQTSSSYQTIPVAFQSPGLSSQSPLFLATSNSVTQPLLSSPISAFSTTQQIAAAVQGLPTSSIVETATNISG